MTGPGDGRLTNPFKFLIANAGAGNDADDVDAASHRIFVYTRPGNVTAGITLNANEWLVGQGVAGASFDAFMGIAPPTGTAARPSIGGARPTLNQIGGSVIALNAGNVVGGLNATNGNGSGITGANVGTLVLSDFDVTVTGGTALSLTTSGTVTATGADNDLNSSSGPPSTSGRDDRRRWSEVQEHFGRQRDSGRGSSQRNSPQQYRNGCRQRRTDHYG